MGTPGEGRYGPRDPAGDPDTGSPLAEGAPTDSTPTGSTPTGSTPTGSTSAHDAPTAQEPERKPWNTSGWLGAAMAAFAFLACVLVGWTGAMMIAALGMALCITGVVRVQRGRATNGAAVWAGVGLAVATFALQYFWATQAAPCASLRAQPEKYEKCYNEHTGLF